MTALRIRLLLLLQVGLFLKNLPAAEITWTNVHGGSWSVAANWSPGKIPGATDIVLLTTPGNYTVTNTFPISVSQVVVGSGIGAGGTQTWAIASVATIAGSVLVASNGVLRMQGSAQLSGSGSFHVQGRWEWTGGSLNRTGEILIEPGGDWRIVPASATLLSWAAGNVINQGRASWESGGLNTAASVTGILVDNQPGAVFTLTPTNTSSWVLSGGTTPRWIQNRGTMRLAASSLPTTNGSVVLQPLFENQGTVELLAGRLTLRGGRSSGLWQVQNGAVLEFENGTNTLGEGSAIGGDGMVEVNGGVLEVTTSRDLTIPSLRFSAGTLRGGTGAPLHVPGLLAWSGGTVTNLTLVNDGEMHLLGTAHILNNAVLENAGHGVLGLGSLITSAASSGLVTNRADGVFEITNTVGWTSAGSGSQTRIANRGTLRRSISSGSITLNSDVDNYGEISLERGILSIPSPNRLIQHEGNLRLAGGDLTVGNPLELRGGTLTGVGRINGSVTNAAVIRPGENGPGQITVQNDYTQTGDGRLEIELGGLTAGSEFDRIVVLDQATLGGTLGVTLRGSFVPNPSHRLVFLTCRVRTNSFDNFAALFSKPPATLTYSNNLVAVTFSSTDWQILPVADASVAESNKLTLTLQLDQTLPLAQKLTWTMVNGPTNAFLNATNGVFTWTPTEAQAPGLYPVTVRAVDTAVPPRTQETSFSLTATEVNLPPVFPIVRDAAIDEELPFELQLLGSDHDLPPNQLTYSLISGPPGLRVSPAGLLNWTPEEDQGPGSYKVTVALSDDGVPARSTNRTFTLTVREVNQAPTLLDPGEQIAVEGELLQTQLLATDVDVPANSLHFVLVSGPSGMTLRPDGLMSWRPSSFQSRSTNTVTVRVFDGGAPSKLDVKSFTVTVLPAPVPALSLVTSVDGLHVRWPVQPSGYRLQWTARLNEFQPGWVDVPVAAASLGDEWEVTLQPSDETRFLRLWKDGNGGVIPGLATITRGPYLQMGTPRSMVVRFRTNRPVMGRVKYGIDPLQLSQQVDGPLTNHHEIQISGLSPDTRYYYSVGSDQVVLASGPTYFFQTAPEGEKATRIWVIGDSGTANVNAASVRNAYLNFTGTRYTDVWLMLGDNAYVFGSDAEYQAAVFNMYPTLLRQTPVWPTIGNHDTDQNHVPVATTPYFSIFSLPTAGEAGGLASGTERYYSFDHAGIHFVCLDSMTSDRGSNGPMATWLRADLAANTNGWLLAFWHHPPYSKGSHDSDNLNHLDPELPEMRANLLPILESYGVDLVLCGHSHSYERSYLLHGHYGDSTSITPDMILDIDSGGLEDGGYAKRLGADGAELGTVYTVAGSSGQVSFGPLNHPAMRVAMAELGSLVIDVDGPLLEARFLNAAGVQKDHFLLRKP